MQLNLAQLKVISASLFHFFRAMDNPPADEMSIPVSAIRPDKKEANTYSATIRYVVNWCGKKENTVRVKFQVDQTGKFMEKTWSYVG